MEADVYPKEEPDRAIEIDGAIGEGSSFHEAFGFYAHGIGPEAAHAPAGWEERMLKVEVPGMRVGDPAVTAWFMEVSDLSLAKLAAGREKDIEFVSEAIKAGLVDPENLRRGIPLMPEADREHTGRRLEVVIARIE
jgi:hypothetical protein